MYPTERYVSVALISIVETEQGSETMLVEQWSRYHAGSSGRPRAPVGVTLKKIPVSTDGKSLKKKPEAWRHVKRQLVSPGEYLPPPADTHAVSQVAL